MARDCTASDWIQPDTGREIVYCIDMNRLDEDPKRRTFIENPKAPVRAVEARMVRVVGDITSEGRRSARVRKSTKRLRLMDESAQFISGAF